MSYTVAFTPEAQEQLLELYRYIAAAAAASPAIAERYTSEIITYCEELRTFPDQGNRRMTFARACASRITASAARRHFAS